jgi:methionyl-tRNA formyltransferase
LNVIFAGTPEFAVRVLEALFDSPHRVTGVLTRPDRPAGRGLKPAGPPVKQLAAARGVPVQQPADLGDAGVQEELRRLRPDAMVVAAYGQILPRAVLDVPRHGCVNVHASLLPRWRGAAPIQRALLAGDRETGVSIMQMDAGLDTGPVLLRESIPVLDEDTAGSLHDRLAELGGRLVVQALDALEAGRLKPVSQNADFATYARKLDAGELKVNWRESALDTCRRVRALNPSPGASASLRDVKLKIWRCTPAPGQGAPGEVLVADASGLRVACGEGVLLITELQRSGGTRLPCADFLRGFHVSTGDRFAL